MTLYDDLLRWSLNQPSWQRDALRRLVTAGELRDQDLDELAQLSLDPRHVDGLPGIPLTAEHLPTQGAHVEDVQLGAVEIGENVNALPSDARLDFEPDGLTIVYGGNGSGKSGYVRVLKRVCRARGTPERVLPNLLRSDPREPSAIVEYMSDGKTHRQPWSPEATPADALAAITIFDRACAAVYVNSENEVAYRPLGLDLLDRLATAAQGVRRRLEAMRAKNDLQAPGPPASIAPAGALRGIWPPQHDLTASAVRKQILWLEDDAQGLARLDRALAASNPLETIAGLKARRAGLLRASRESDAALAALRAAVSLPTAVATMEEANRAIAQAHKSDLDRSGLPGVGGVLWRALWAAAERFSNEAAYPQHKFPNTEPGARCVLCGQELSADAADRFQALRSLVELELSMLAGRATDEVERLRQELAKFLADGNARERVPELRTTDEEAWTRVSSLIELAIEWSRGAITSDSMAANPEDQIGVDNPSVWLHERVVALETELAVLERAGQAEELAKMKVEQRELQARFWVSSNAESIEAEAARLKARARIAAALATCDTGQITLQGNQLTARYVTEALREDFARELKRLNPSRVPVRIVQRGSYGSTYHRLQVASAATLSANVSEVVSDGEFRGLALANFFAETLHSSTCSAVVLDDPVTSLDHRFRRRVAERLVEEGGRRQVIVFTHDLVFLQDLVAAAEQARVPVGFRRLILTRAHVGVPQAGPPWDGMKVGQRIEAQQQDLNRVRQIYESGEQETYEREVERWYSRHRSTWERAVEEVLFVDAVNRFRSQIKTNSLVSGRVWIIDEQDVRDVELGMTKCSAWTDAHDEPAAADRPTPPPDELRDDLNSLRDWTTRMKQKRR